MTAPDITIPPEALEAAAIDLHRSMWGHDCYSWADADETTREHFRKHARAACLAMLRAWTGATYYTGKGVIAQTEPEIILPLPEPRTSGEYAAESGDCGGC